MGKVTGRPSGTVLTLSDLVHVVDVDDLTSGPLGTSKKYTIGQIVALAGGGADGNGIYTGSGSLSGATTVTMGAFDLRFTGTGRVGIGTSTPTQKLEVVGGVRVDASITNALFVSSSNGRVGIGGEAAPDAALEIKCPATGNQYGLTVKKNDDSESKFRISNDGQLIINAESITTQVGLGVVSNGNAKLRLRSDSADSYGIRHEISSGSISFATHESGNATFGNGTDYGQKLNVFGGQYISGDLGIGTTTPTEKLNVVGNTYTTGQGSFGTGINPNSHLQVTASGKIVGIAGISNAITTNNGAAIRGTANSTAAVEVYGVDGLAAGTNATGDRTGVRGNAITTGSRNHVGVKGTGTNGTQQNIGVWGTTGNGTTGTIIRGVNGSSLYQGSSNAYAGYFSAQGIKTGQNIGLFATAANASTNYAIKTDGNINMANLPTSSLGLSTGDLWNNAGVINIA